MHQRWDLAVTKIRKRAFFFFSIQCHSVCHIFQNTKQFSAPSLPKSAYACRSQLLHLPSCMTEDGWNAAGMLSDFLVSCALRTKAEITWEHSHSVAKLVETTACGTVFWSFFLGGGGCCFFYIHETRNGGQFCLHLSRFPDKDVWVPLPVGQHRTVVGIHVHH